VKVQYVEGGSAVVADRVAEEKSKPQADILVTLLLLLMGWTPPDGIGVPEWRSRWHHWRRRP
jgi:hypothetical protein